MAIAGVVVAIALWRLYSQPGQGLGDLRLPVAGAAVPVNSKDPFAR